MTLSERTLYVDLDETLLCIDLLQERLVLAFLKEPQIVFAALRWAWQGGIPRVKIEFAQRYPLQTDHLPFNSQVLVFLQQQKQAGVRLVLATGSPLPWAEAIAHRLQIFDGVLATTLETGNLTGRRKLAAIRGDSNGEPFAYAGDAWVDRPIFEAAQTPIVVGAPARLAGAHADRARVFPSETSFSKPGWTALRPHQWSKNILVFAPVAAAHQLQFNAVPAGAAFVCLSLTASGLYVLNDLLDLDADRQHPEKHKRALASGRLLPMTALTWIGLSFGAAATVASFLPFKLTLFVIAYVIINLLYSHKIKHIAVLDLIALAILYTLRVFAGGAACEQTVSPWLAALTFFMALSLAHLKRYIELAKQARLGLSNASRPSYLTEDLHLISIMGIGSGLIAVILLALYVTSPQAAPLYRSSQILFLACVLQIYWIERLWLMAFRGQMPGDPISFIVRDRVSYLVAALAALVVWLAI